MRERQVPRGGPFTRLLTSPAVQDRPVLRRRVSETGMDNKSAGNVWQAHRGTFTQYGTRWDHFRTAHGQVHRYRCATAGAGDALKGPPRPRPPPPCSCCPARQVTTRSGMVAEAAAAATAASAPPRPCIPRDRSSPSSPAPRVSTPPLPAPAAPEGACAISAWCVYDLVNARPHSGFSL